MGMATFRLSASCASEVVFGSVVSDPLVGPAVFTEAGQRPFVDITPVLRSQIGRALVPRVLDVMKARSAVALPGWARTRGRRSGATRPGGRSCGVYSR